MFHKGGDTNLGLNRLREMRRGMWRVHNGDEGFQQVTLFVEITGTKRAQPCSKKRGGGAGIFAYKITFKQFHTLFTDRPRIFNIKKYSFKHF
jgi:hypothetical protein